VPEKEANLIVAGSVPMIKESHLGIDGLIIGDGTSSEWRFRAAKNN
jgi:hypothetical protein